MSEIKNPTLKKNSGFCKKVVLVGRSAELMINSAPCGADIKKIKTGRLRLPWPLRGHFIFLMSAPSGPNFYKSWQSTKYESGRSKSTECGRSLKVSGWTKRDERGRPYKCVGDLNGIKVDGPTKKTGKWKPEGRLCLFLS